MLNKSSESAQVEESSSQWNLFEAIELVERQFGLCNKKMPKTTVSSMRGKSINKTVLFIFNNTICFSFQPERKIFQSESKDIFFLRAEKGITEWDVDSGKLKILSGKNIWWHYTPLPPHSHSPSWPQWKQALALHGPLLLPCPFWRKIQLGGVASTLLLQWVCLCGWWVWQLPIPLCLCSCC